MKIYNKPDIELIYFSEDIITNSNFDNEESDQTGVI